MQSRELPVSGMKEPPVFTQAGTNLYKQICGLYDACKTELLKNNILQWGHWGNSYPDPEYLKNALGRGELFVLTEKNEITGSVILNESQSREWEAVAWKYRGGRILVVHALVIDPNCQNRGYGKLLLNYCEQYARKHNYNSIRLDSFKKNAAAGRLYLGFSYKIAGTAVFDMKPEGNREYYCFEKSL